MEQDNRLMSLHIIEILNKYSSPDNKLTQKEIASYLDNDYGYFVSRRTLSTYIQILNKYGYIESSRSGCYSKTYVVKDNQRISSFVIRNNDKKLVGAVLGTKNWINERLKQLKIEDYAIDQIMEKIEVIISFSGELGKWIQFTKEERKKV